jgi:ABC-2 type transport system ATP-binding protein
VQRARADASRVTLHVDETHSTLPAVIDLLRELGIGLSDLHTHRPTLEDVFVERTGRHLRDA